MLMITIKYYHYHYYNVTPRKQLDEVPSSLNVTNINITTTFNAFFKFGICSFPQTAPLFPPCLYLDIGCHRGDENQIPDLFVEIFISSFIHNCT